MRVIVCVCICMWVRAIMFVHSYQLDCNFRCMQSLMQIYACLLIHFCTSTLTYVHMYVYVGTYVYVSPLCWKLIVSILFTIAKMYLLSLKGSWWSQVEVLMSAYAHIRWKINVLAHTFIPTHLFTYTYALAVYQSLGFSMNLYKDMFSIMSSMNMCVGR